MTKRFIVATAGHVDHGKSCLVRALTGSDPDRLPEEKARGITIDLGFAQLTLSGADGDTYMLGLVDVPGHEDLVKNMVAGVGAIDIALLVVAADDGWMPQTEEHLQILQYLGVTQAVVALTKVDLLAERSGASNAAAHSELAIEEVRRHLAGTSFEKARIVRVSSPSGTGLDELRAALAETLDLAPAPKDAGKPRLNVDRVFTLRGIGTVVTGSLTGGRFHRSDHVIVQPNGARAHIRTIQSHGADVGEVAPGSRTALNLPELTAGDRTAHSINRGDTVTVECVGAPMMSLSAEFVRSARAISERKLKPLASGSIVRWHHGSADVTARVFFADGAALDSGGKCLGQLRFERPAFALAGERFILRDWAQQRTLAGGLILDLSAAPLNSARQRDLLERRAAAPLDATVWLQTELERTGFSIRSTVLGHSVFSHEEVEASAQELIKCGEAIAAGTFLCSAQFWKEAVSKAEELIDAHHRARPEQHGLSLLQLRNGLVPQLTAPELFPCIIDFLSRKGHSVDDRSIWRSAHRLALPQHLEKVAERLRHQLGTKPLDPPSRKELAPDSASQQALKFLVDTREVVELSNDVAMLATAYATARTRVRILLRDGPLTAGALRQGLETSRRVVIPLLERLDKEGLTTRQGDSRVLK